jgi:hypothetical protein
MKEWALVNIGGVSLVILATSLVRCTRGGVDRLHSRPILTHRIFRWYSQSAFLRIASAAPPSSSYVSASWKIRWTSSQPPGGSGAGLAEPESCGSPLLELPVGLPDLPGLWALALILYIVATAVAAAVASLPAPETVVEAVMSVLGPVDSEVGPGVQIRLGFEGMSVVEIVVILVLGSVAEFVADFETAISSDSMIMYPAGSAVGILAEVVVACPVFGSAVAFPVEPVAVSQVESWAVILAEFVVDGVVVGCEVVEFVVPVMPVMFVIPVAPVMPVIPAAPVMLVTSGVHEVPVVPVVPVAYFLTETVADLGAVGLEADPGEEMMVVGPELEMVVEAESVFDSEVVVLAGPAVLAVAAVVEPLATGCRDLQTRAIEVQTHHPPRRQTRLLHQKNCRARSFSQYRRRRPHTT